MEKEYGDEVMEKVMEKEYGDEVLGDEVMDESWIKEFEKTDKLYEKYYLDDLYNVKLNSIYVDESRNIMNMKEERFLIRNRNVLTKDELVGILKKNSIYNNKKFSIHSILKYNIDLEPIEIEGFLKRKPSKNFLTLVNHIEDIPFKKTITMFQDLNDLFFLFVEKGDAERKTVTKRVYINKPFKKTMRSK
jgi:hypothetical protein